MTCDVQLHCRRTWPLKPAIRIREPAALRQTSPGTFGGLPPEWLSPDRLIAPAEALAKWARATVGDPIVRAINQHAQKNGGLTRLLISSEDALRVDILGAPWELLEHTPAALRSAQLSVVRLLRDDASIAAPLSVPRLRLLVLHADPAGNIAELPTHLQALQNLAAANDEMLEAQIVPFPSTQSVLQQTTGFNPHIVYYIGHGSQSGTGQVHLLIDQGAGIEMAAFAAFLKQLGSPRVVILNACESFAGTTLDPYLGAALRLTPEIDFVVSMQMKEPIPAATAFAGALLAAIAGGGGLAAAMAAGRTAMAEVADPDFEVTPYIPVLMQRTRQDVPFTVDAGEHERIRLLKLMASRLEQIDHLPRAKEGEIRRVLTGQAKYCVSVLTGPPDCGKSTTVRAVLASLLTDEEIRKGTRYLYFSAKGLPRTQSLADEVSQLLAAFARDCGAFTKSLLDRLAADASANPQASPLSTLATWLEHQKQFKYRFVVVLDDLDPAVATEIASRASGLVTAGHLMVISESNDTKHEALVERLTLGPMTEAEIASAVPEWDETRVQEVALDTEGIPTLVAAAKRGPRTRGAAELQNEALYLVAISDLPLPAEVAAQFGIDAEISEDIIVAADGALSLPARIRDELLAGLEVEFEVQLRQQLADAYETVAYAERTGGFRRARVISLYREALRQRVRVLESGDADPTPEETLDQAREDLFDLDYQLLEEGDEPAEAITLWNLYRKAAARFGDHREADARYARLLQRRGSIKEADDILRSWSKSGPADRLQIRIILAHDQVLHDRGEDPKERLALLERAGEILEKLRAAGTLKKRELAELEAEIEQATGNALGYGEGSNPQDAVRRLGRAVEIFESLRDYRAESAYSDKIEVARYNRILPDDERAEAIERIRRSIDALVARSVQWDAIDRLYELGRLGRDPAERAKWYRAAYERAGDGYAPNRWHAAIHWKREEVEAKQRPFAEVAPEILALCGELEAWKENAWSRRVQRDALRFLARNYGAAGDVAQQRRFLVAARDVITSIEQRRERRGDRAARIEVDEEIRALPPDQPEGGLS